MMKLLKEQYGALDFTNPWILSKYYSVIGEKLFDVDAASEVPKDVPPSSELMTNFLDVTEELVGSGNFCNVYKGLFLFPETCVNSVFFERLAHLF